MQFGGSQVLCDTRKTAQMDERTGTLELAETPTAIAPTVLVLCPDWLAGDCVLSYIIG